jgi:hypothetical protein
MYNAITVLGQTEYDFRGLDADTDYYFTIVDYNKKYGKDIHFGAANIITDKPASTEFTWDHSSDLTNINKERKAQARMLTVTLALDGISNEFKNRKMSCSKVF